MSQPCSFFHGQTSPIRPKSARWPVVWASLCCTLLLSLPAMARNAQPLPVAMPEASAALAAPALPASSPAPLSQAAAELLSWIAQTGNHAGAPYVVVDKRQARMWVFDAQHRLLGASPALLGLTVGDREAADITQRDVTRLSKDARITPAGRFASEPGVNLQGEDVIWLDYAAGLALHRVRPGLAQASRLQRLAAEVASAQRVSMGCVVLPVAFYERVLRPVLGQGAGVVYVLPEHSPLPTWLPSWSAPTHTASEP